MYPRIIIAMLTLHILALPAFAAWHETDRSPAQTQVLAEVEAAVAKHQQPVVVFDLDSTLYLNHGRWVAILNEFGKTEGIEQLATFQADHLTDSFDHLGVLTKDAKLDAKRAEQLLPEFKTFWLSRFFSSDYVQFDRALPGAVAFVKALYGKGATIVYITGRDEQNMRVGTEAKLKRDGFPLSTERTTLFMKPTPNAGQNLSQEARRQMDTEWKKQVVTHVKAMGTVVASFENEPSAINLYFDNFHKAGNGVAVFLDTDMAPAPERIALRPGVRTISGFLR